MEKPPSSSEHVNYSSQPKNHNNKPIKAKNISILVVATSLPVLYASILHIPPSTLFKDTIFWFLMSNSIIIFIAVDMGVLVAPSHDVCERKLYEDLVAYGKSRSTYFIEEPANTIDKSLVVKEKLIDDTTTSINEVMPSSSSSEDNKSEDTEASSMKEVDKALVLADGSNMKKVKKTNSVDPSVHNERSLITAEKPLRRSKTREKKSPNDKNESHDYEKLSDEELNRRVEEFIRRYYREMRLQLNNESI